MPPISSSCGSFRSLTSAQSLTLQGLTTTMPSAGIWGTFDISRQVGQESSGGGRWGKMAQAGLEFVILLPHPPNCWGYSCAPPSLAKNKLLLKFNLLLIIKITLRFPLKPPKSYWNMPDFLELLWYFLHPCAAPEELLLIHAGHHTFSQDQIH